MKRASLDPEIFRYEFRYEYAHRYTLVCWRHPVPAVPQTTACLRHHAILVFQLERRTATISVWCTITCDEEYPESPAF